MDGFTADSTTCGIRAAVVALPQIFHPCDSGRRQLRKSRARQHGQRVAALLQPRNGDIHKFSASVTSGPAIHHQAQPSASARLPSGDHLPGSPAGGPTRASPFPLKRTRHGFPSQRRAPISRRGKNRNDEPSALAGRHVNVAALPRPWSVVTRTIWSPSLFSEKSKRLPPSIHVRDAAFGRKMCGSPPRTGTSQASQAFSRAVDNVRAIWA